MVYRKEFILHTNRNNIPENNQLLQIRSILVLVAAIKLLCKRTRSLTCRLLSIISGYVSFVVFILKQPIVLCVSS